jgi:hypothetical protein
VVHNLRNAIAATTLCLLLAAAAPGAFAATPVDTTPPFTDANYHQYILYDMDQTEVDVLIMPSASAYALRDMALMKQSVEAWDAGINAIGGTWLAPGLNIHVYRVGFDTIPNAALWDPEVVIFPAQFNPVLLAGIGLEPMNTVGVYTCHGRASPVFASPEELAALPGFHTHAGSSWGMVRTGGEANAAGRGCANGGTTCFAINTNFQRTPDDANRRDMYDLNSHEFGHCLGIGHVGDALDFTANLYPRDDIMSYENDGWDAGHVLCVSTLDILGLKQVYGWLLGQAGYPQYPSGGYVWMDPTAWSAVSCPEPTTPPLGMAAADPFVTSCIATPLRC